MYPPNNRTSKHREQKMQELKGLIDKPISVEDLNPLPATDRTVNKQQKKISKDISK